MATRHPIAHALHDVGLAAWFGGTLMGAVGVNRAAGTTKDRGDRTKVADDGWARWTPVNLAAIGAHLVGSVGLLSADLGRAAGQQGVPKDIVVKSSLTVAALATTAYARVLGQKVIDAAGAPAEDGTTPSATTPAHVADAQRKLQRLQWAIPVLTGALVAYSSKMSEDYRPSSVAGGVLQRLVPGA